MPNPPQVTKVGKHLSSPSLYPQGASYFLDSGKQLQTGEAGKGRRKEGREEGRESGKETWEDRREEEEKRNGRKRGHEGRKTVRQGVGETV